ncbi:MAG TPA: hypothetical protein VJM11_15040 [Nevskiaceae bacterium]|nr:hypothetical protein [Nevskiaceae bacterium]
MRRMALVAALALVPGAALADDVDLDIQPGATQDDFHDVAKDLAGVLNYKSVSPAESTGIAGFSIGVVGTWLSTDDDSSWTQLTGEDVDGVPMIGLNVQKGLPFGIDIGASYSAVPSSDVNLIGAEVRWAMLEGGVATPAIAIRGTYSALSGVDDVDFDAYGTDISISKGFGPVTPYAGVGYQWSTFEADEEFGLEDEKPDGSRVFIGLRLTALIGFTPEYERVDGRDVYNLRIGFAF